MHKFEKINENCAMIVNSCDAYQDVWELFFCALKDNWADCEVEIYLNTEKKTFKFEGLKLNEVNVYAKAGLDKPWGGRLLETLKGINKEFVISLFDDFVLEGKVNTQKIQQCISWMKSDENIAVFYFNNIPGNNTPEAHYPEFELIGQRNDYRLNSAPAIWRRKKLMEFTGEIDNPWAWEFFGSARTYSTSDRFYCAPLANENTFIYNYALGGAIRRGKWVSSIVTPLVKKYNLNLDLNKRGIAGESLGQGKYSLKWKIDFFVIGFRMVGLKALIFLFRILKKKIFKL